MEKSIEIVWTVSSKKDLQDIYNHLCTYLSEEKAYEIIERITKKVDVLETMPLAGQKEPLLSKLKREYRRLVEGNYKIIYNFATDVVYINRIFDTRQNPDKLTVK
jgi:plasmid stabilization system protein ParE